MNPAALAPAAAAVIDATLALAAGAALGVLWVPAASRALTRAARAGMLCALASHAALLLLQAAAMSELPLAQALPEVPTVLTGTHYGTAWLAGLAALAVGAGVALLPSLGRNSARLLLAALGAALYAKAMSGHAAAHGDLSGVLLLHWCHLAAVTVWSGVVFAGALARLPQALAPGDGLPRYARSLSSSATAALAIAVTTGAGSAWINLAQTPLSAHAPYQALLLAKIVLVLCAMGLGGYNRWVGMPALLHPEPAARQAAAWRFGAVLRIEAVVLLIVLALAALLGATPPDSA